MAFIKPASSPTDATALHIAHYNDLGETARHYSLVRMTLGTFWLGLPLLVIQTNASSRRWSSFLIVAGMCAFGLVVYWIFTERAFAKRGQQVDMLREALKAAAVEATLEEPRPWGWEGYWLGIIGYGLVFLVDWFVLMP